MSEFTGTIKNNPKTQKFTALNVNKDSDQSYRTQTQKGQKPSIQRKVFQPATKKLDETIEITDKEIHFTRKRIHFSAEKNKNIRWANYIRIGASKSNWTFGWNT